MLQCWEFAILIVKDVVQIGFWVVAGTVAWLSYSHARRTIFQPARNEVFKVQIETLQQLMQKLNWKSGLEAWIASGLASSADISMNRLFKAYAKDRFAVAIESEAYDKLSSVAMMVSPDAKGFKLIQGPADDNDEDEAGTKLNFDWGNYTWDTFDVSAKYQEVMNLVDEASNDPVLPLPIISKVRSLQKEMNNTVVRAAKDLERIVREFPRHYPNPNSLDGADLTWAHNMRTERGQRLYDELNELKQEIRNYLQTDKLFGE